MAYQIPPDFTVEGLEADQLERIANLLELYGSLPFVWRAADLSQVPEEALHGLAKVVEQLQIEEARKSPAAFVQYAFRAEKTNDVIENAAHHVEWHQFLDENDRAILFAPVEHGKTQQTAIGRVIFILGTNPSARIAIVSNTFEPHATKILGSIRTHIESNPRVHAVFPDLKPSTLEGDKWGQSALTIHRGTIAKEPSVSAVGIYGPINGARLDGIILDDILNFENTRTPEQIQKLIDWLDTEVFTRVQEGGWIHWIGTPWNPLDPMHVVAKRPAWASRRYSAVENPKEPMESWRPIWPQQFSVARLKKIYDGTTPTNFARKYLCEVRLDESSRFQQAWIDHAKMLGRGKRLVDRQPHGPDGAPFRCFTGVDIGIGKGEGHDLSCLFTVAVDNYRRKLVCEVKAGRWTAPDLVLLIQSTAMRFGSQVYVEDNQAQAFIVQWLNGMNALPIKGFTTSAQNKYDEHYGVESVAVEMRNGGWVIPCDAAGNCDPEVEAWTQEMLFYTPDAHTGDRLMASWFAREAARANGAPMFRTQDTTQR